MRLSPDGWVDRARRVPSPNFDARPEFLQPTLIVLHGISLPPGRFSGDAIERLFTNRLDADAHPYFAGLRGLRVSAHFLVRRDGELLQFVSTAARAWHAGVSSWRGRERCNDAAIGIELEGTDAQPYEQAQYASLARLLRALSAALPLRGLAAHSDVAPGRKTDPGVAFGWAQALVALLQA